MRYKSAEIEINENLTWVCSDRNVVVGPLLFALQKEGLSVTMEQAHAHPQKNIILARSLCDRAHLGHKLVMFSNDIPAFYAMRVAVKQGLIHADEVTINFLNHDIEEGLICLNPVIDKEGRLDFWPNDFFDVFDKLLDQLL